MSSRYRLRVVPQSGIRPGLLRGYAAKTLPDVREAMEEGEWEVAREQAGMLDEALDRATALITEADDKARAIAPRLVSRDMTAYMG